MTAINITPAPTGMRIELTDLGASKVELLEAFNSCAAGQCACASDEYEKVAAMSVTADGDAITVEVTTKPGETIDPSCVTECLDQAPAAESRCC